jgi:hypothetical protein
MDTNSSATSRRQVLGGGLSAGAAAAMPTIIPAGQARAASTPSDPRTGAQIKQGTLKIYPGFPHGMLTTHADVINQDLLAFIRG